MLRMLIKRYADAWELSSFGAVRTAILQQPGLTPEPASGAPPRAFRIPLEPPDMQAQRMGAGSWELPALPTSGDIARWLGLDAGELAWLADTRRGFREAAPARAQHYRYQWVAKRAGGFRLLEIPKVRLRDIQRRVLHEVLDRVMPHDAAHGFRAGRSTLSNATPHVGKRVVLRLDLRDFFLGIRANRVRGLFKAMGYPIGAANVLTGLCTASVPASALKRPADAQRYEFEPLTLSWTERQPFLEAHLPQGAPTSPALANLCAFNLDVRLQAYARALEAEYTRYADDLVFSGGEVLHRAVDRMPARIGAIALEEGFVVNHRKTRVMRRGRRQIVTGIVVNERPNLAREEYDRLKAMLHNARGIGAPSDAWRSRMLGCIAHAQRLNAAKGARLRQMFAEVCGVQPGHSEHGDCSSRDSGP